MSIDEQAQIQAMLGLLAEKFIKDPDELSETIIRSLQAEIAS